MSDKDESVYTFKDLKRLLEGADDEPVKVSTASSGKALGVTDKANQPIEEPRGPELTPEAEDEGIGRLSRIDRENLRFLKEKLADAERRERKAANLEFKLEGMVSQQAKARAQLDARSEEIAAAQAELRAKQAKLRADLKRLADVGTEERRLSQKVEAFKARDKKLKKAEAAVKKKQAAARKLRADLRAALEDNDTLHRQLRSANRKTAKLVREIAAFEEQQEAIAEMEVGIDWVLENGGDGESLPWPYAVVVGSGPFDEGEFSEFLIDRGVDIYNPDSEDVPCMIVGREDWAEEQLEMQIAAQQGRTLKVYSQEMALMSLAAGTDMFDSAEGEMLEELGGSHPALQFLREGELRWPLFMVPAIPEKFKPWEFEDVGVDKSPLKELGYTVGKTKGLPVNERRAILTEAYLGELPDVHSDEYMRDWGHPRTRRRLWRMANHLAWLAKAWRHMPSHAYAVDDWVRDLAMLEKKFFKPWMRFKWPNVTVPSSRRRR